MMKLSLLALALLQVASAQIVIDTSVLQAGALLDNTGSFSGTKKCALINIAMDESQSMELEQNFMKQDAIPGMLDKLYGTGFDYDHVFICSNGFGYTQASGPHYYQHLGCSYGNPDGSLDNAGITSWVTSGRWEEGYHAMIYSIANVPQSITSVTHGSINLHTECGTLAKNIILVTDEDRDALYPATQQEMKDYINDNGYILNMVIDSTINNATENVGFRSSSGGEHNVVYQANLPSGSYTTFTINTPGLDFTDFVTHDDSWAPDASEHYIPLIVDEPGAVWNLKSLRDGVEGNTALRASFVQAFIDVKVEEMSCPAGTIVGGFCTCPGGSLVDGVCTCTSPLLNDGNGCVCPPGTRLVNGNCQSSTEVIDIVPNGGGDPHITTFAGEHYEYHGQCDLVMMKDPEFMQGLGLDVHIRTKLVRYWSYIQSVAIRLGTDILEIQGAVENNEESHYWINFEYEGELEEFAGFPVTQQLPNCDKRIYTIDLSSKYPGAAIVVQLYKEFVKVKFEGTSKELFGKTVGLLGDYETGKTLARDGATVMHDFTEFGDEWQVLPSEPRIFHDVAKPQYPELCIKPEDPRGERQRRLAESSISIEEAEAACGKTTADPLSIKDCVYDILATQDLGMVGAF